MTAKLMVQGAGVASREAGALFDGERAHATTEVRPLRIALSGTVVVDFEVAVTQPDGSATRAVVRVEFPDEVRSMLESSSWSRGTSICEAVSRLGAAFLERTGVGGLVCASADK